MAIQCKCDILEGKQSLLFTFLIKQVVWFIFRSINVYISVEKLKMSRPNYLTSEETDEIVISDDDGSDHSEESGDDDFVPENESDSDDSDSNTENEIENEREESAISNENTDSLFVSKDGTVWNPRPIQVEGGRLRTENVISLRPGSTRYAKSRVDDLKDAFMLFFPPPIEKLILNHTNAFIEGRKNVPIIPIDANLLYAYIGVLILAGVHR